MKCDGNKVIELRTKNALTQEALAGKSKLNVRTIQRAEAGDTLGLQTVQELASALGVQHSELLTDEPSSDTADEQAYDGETIAIALRPQPSARTLLDIIYDCRDCRLGHNVDLDADTVEIVKDFCTALRRVLPALCPGYPDAPAAHVNDTLLRSEATVFFERITVEADLNATLAKLRSSGLDVYAGSFVDLQKVPRWDEDYGVWATTNNQRPEAVKIAVIRIGSRGERQLSVRVKCEMIPF
jgi:transcriptional regulator with XRE-family HTH domain